MNCPIPPCVDPEMKNALAIERNTASITALTKSFQKISIDFDFLKKSVDELNKRLKEIIIEGFEEIFNERMKEEKEARVSGDAELQATCDSLNLAKANKTELEEEKIARADADLVLQARIQSIEVLAPRLVTEESSKRKIEDDKLDERVSALEGGSGTIAEQIEAERLARIDADTINSSKIEEEKNTRIEAINSLITTLESKNDEQDEEISIRATKEELASESARIDDNTNAIASINIALADLGTRITTEEGKIVTLNERVSEFEAEIQQAKTDIVTIRQMVVDASNRELAHYETLSGRIDSIERMILEYIQR